MFDVAFTLRASGAADPDVVWGRYTDISLWSEWSPHIVSVEADSGRLSPGLTGRVNGLLGVYVHFEVADVDELARTWSWRAWLGPVSMQLHHEVVPKPGGGTATSLRMRAPAPLVVAYAPVAEIALVRLVRP